MRLTYTDHEGFPRTLEEIKVIQGKCGRWWIWSEQEKINLAYKEKSLDDALKSAIASLMFIIHLRDKRISALQHVADCVDSFIEKVRPEEENP